MSNTLILDPTRLDLASRLAAARTATDELFSIVRPEALYDRPIPERHRLIFYLGHLEAMKRMAGSIDESRMIRANGRTVLGGASYQASIVRRFAPRSTNASPARARHGRAPTSRPPSTWRSSTV